MIEIITSIISSLIGFIIGYINVKELFIKLEARRKLKKNIAMNLKMTNLRNDYEKLNLILKTNYLTQLSKLERIAVLEALNQKSIKGRNNYIDNLIMKENTSKQT
jgi:hypothetical protein